jgi:hypothetical protein
MLVSKFIFEKGRLTRFLFLGELQKANRLKDLTLS